MTLYIRTKQAIHGTNGHGNNSVHCTHQGADAWLFLSTLRRPERLMGNRASRKCFKMCRLLHMKREYSGMDDGNKNLTDGAQGVLEYLVFTYQNVEYMNRPLPQFWGQAQLQENKIE